MRQHGAARFRLMCASLVGLLTLGTSLALAQNAALRGIVRDSAGTPIQDADVGIAAQRALTRTNAEGRFWLTRLRQGEAEVSIRRLGYEPRTIRVALRGQVDTVEVQLEARAAELGLVDVSASETRQRSGIEGFHRRRVLGLGTYIAREEIDARNTMSVSDMLRNVPGIRFIKVRGSSRGVRFPQTSIRRGDCMPMIWIDGQAAPGMEVDDVIVPDIEGVELYGGPSTTPMQFSQSRSDNTCGTIVIWSRPPPGARSASKPAKP